MEKERKLGNNERHVLKEASTHVSHILQPTQFMGDILRLTWTVTQLKIEESTSILVLPSYITSQPTLANGIYVGWLAGCG
jgi:hypothetical protein